MADDDERTLIRQSGLPGDTGGDPADDWLAGDLDWGEPGEAGAPARPGRRGASSETAGAGSGSGQQSLGDVFRRRRAVALIAIVGGVIVVVLIALIAFGSGGSSPPAATTQTTPAITTTPLTTTAGTTTTTPNTSGSAQIVIPAGGTLVQGDTGAEVKKLQQALNAVGSASLTADGNFGPATQQAVIAFQQANGLTPDGVVGAATAKALNDALAHQG